jgi:hypothetical protein
MEERYFISERSCHGAQGFAGAAGCACGADGAGMRVKQPFEESYRHPRTGERVVVGEGREGGDDWH